MKAKKSNYMQLYIIFTTSGNGRDHINGHCCAVPASCTPTEAREYAARLLPVLYGDDKIYTITKLDLYR